MAAEKSTQTKTIKEFETERGVMLHGDVNVNKKVTEDEFEKLAADGSTGVAHQDRIAYLRSKGIQVTRQNMIDSSL